MKEAVDSFFHRVFYRKVMKILRASFFSLMSVALKMKILLVLVSRSL